MRRRIALALVAALMALSAGAAWVGLRDWHRGYYNARVTTVVRFTLHSPLVHRGLH